MRALAAAAIAAALASPAHATLITLAVTPASTLRAAVATANADSNLANTYDLKLAPGTYLNDFAPTITRPMVIEGTSGAASTILKATVPLPNSKGILLTIASLTVRGLTLTGAAISNALGGNGAAIRDQIGTGGSPKNGTLTVLNSVFRGNQEGILTGGSGGQEHVVVSGSRFLDNGNPNQATFQHGLYVNSAASVLVSESTFCGQLIGHNVKVRSAVTRITGASSYEGVLGPGCTRAGTASRGIDVPNGGVLTMSNDHLFQGPLSQNSAMFAYGEEGVTQPVNSALLTNVGFSSTSGGTGIQWYGGANPCTLSNVSFAGLSRTQAPVGCAVPAPVAVASLAAVQAAPVAVDEPGSLTLLAGAAAAFALVRWRRRRTGA